jgi:hypothetical protein
LPMRQPKVANIFHQDFCRRVNHTAEVFIPSQESPSR